MPGALGRRTSTRKTACAAGASNWSSGAVASLTSAPSSTDANAQDAEARKIFDQLDTNHDGILTLDEFSRATIRAK